jgi:hypothetical protein
MSYTLVGFTEKRSFCWRRSFGPGRTYLLATPWTAAVGTFFMM